MGKSFGVGVSCFACLYLHRLTTNFRMHGGVVSQVAHESQIEWQGISGKLGIVSIDTYICLYAEESLPRVISILQIQMPVVWSVRLAHFPRFVQCF
jgi:hypothetical protein